MQNRDRLRDRHRKQTGGFQGRGKGADRPGRGGGADPGEGKGKREGQTRVKGRGRPGRGRGADPGEGLRDANSCSEDRSKQGCTVEGRGLEP